jgi:hypothetical protein
MTHNSEKDDTFRKVLTGDRPESREGPVVRLAVAGKRSHNIGNVRRQ